MSEVDNSHKSTITTTTTIPTNTDSVVIGSELKEFNRGANSVTGSIGSIGVESISSVSTPAGSEIIDGEERKFICQHCNHTFTRKHNLKSHLLIHTREKPFHCSICSSKFRRLHDLKRHEKLHTGEKPYQCKHCGRKFARMDALVRHNNSQSGCTLLVDDGMVKEGISRDSSSASSPHSTPLLTPIQHPSTTSTSTTSSASGTTTGGTSGLVTHSIPNLPVPSRRNYETGQWKLNNTLPSINRLTPLMQAIDSGDKVYEQSQVQNFDLLPYVKLLESRIAALETKLSATETKLAQLKYVVHHNHPDQEL